MTDTAIEPPFDHGVASFDPTSDSVVLWTRAPGVARVPSAVGSCASGHTGVLAGSCAAGSAPDLDTYVSSSTTPRASP